MDGNSTNSIGVGSLPVDHKTLVKEITNVVVKVGVKALLGRERRKSRGDINKQFERGDLRSYQDAIHTLSRTRKLSIEAT